MAEEEKKKKKIKKAQLTSLISKIIGVAFLVTMYSLYVCNKVDLEVKELLLVTFSIVGLCGTIDINLFTDKILDAISGLKTKKE